MKVKIIVYGEGWTIQKSSGHISAMTVIPNEGEIIWIDESYLFDGKPSVEELQSCFKVVRREFYTDGDIHIFVQQI